MVIPGGGGGFGVSPTTPMDMGGGGGGFGVQPMTPGGMGGMGGTGGTGGTGGDGGRGGSGGGGGGYRPPGRGTGPITNTYNIGGDSMVTQGNQVAQKTPKKTFKQPKIAMGQKMIGDPNQAMKQLSAMNQTPFMRQT
tara:strand:- start:88 stop:498 length:411 start_codon:yes stop_codon:yes gene_type:complete